MKLAAKERGDHTVFRGLLAASDFDHRRDYSKASSYPCLAGSPMAA